MCRVLSVFLLQWVGALPLPVLNCVSALHLCHLLSVGVCTAARAEAGRTPGCVCVCVCVCVCRGGVVTFLSQLTSEMIQCSTAVRNIYWGCVNRMRVLGTTTLQDLIEHTFVKRSATPKLQA